jgi:hypothetical protein
MIVTGFLSRTWDADITSVTRYIGVGAARSPEVIFIPLFQMVVRLRLA